MSKLLVMGMPLEAVVRASTWTPARIIHREELGHLNAGAVADVAVWNLLSGDFGFGDASGGGLKGKQRLVSELTLKDGRVVWDWNGRKAEDYRKLEPTYGIRPGIDEIIRPK